MYEYIAISAGNALAVDLVVIDIRHDSVGENLQAKYNISGFGLSPSCGAILQGQCVSKYFVAILGGFEKAASNNVGLWPRSHACSSGRILVL